MQVRTEWIARITSFDLHQRNFRNRAGREGGEIDFEIIGVEAHRHVELESGGHRGAGRRHMAGEKGDDPGRRVAGERRARGHLVPATATRTLPGTGLAMVRR